MNISQFVQGFFTGKGWIFAGVHYKMKQEYERKGFLFMNVKEMISHVDHTQLKAYATWDDIEKLCDEALEFGTASVCIPPCYIKRVHQKYGSRLKICTVVGFPLGYSVTEAKVAETKKALEDGAEEIDMVINISDVKNGDYDKVAQEIIAVKRECLNHVLKVIIETCYLTEEEKIELERQNKIYSIQSEINNLKSQLAETDYIVIKCQEYELAGKDLPDEYDIIKFSEERDSIRKQINVLEKELSEI